MKVKEIREVTPIKRYPKEFTFTFDEKELLALRSAVGATSGVDVYSMFKQYTAAEFSNVLGDMYEAFIDLILNQMNILS